jgi:polysaccharide pyruvyl transferase WcaK-like protein
MSNHVSIIGSALSGNKGASAMLEASVHSIVSRLPSTTFTLFSMYPNEDCAQNPYKSLEIVDARPFQLGVVINFLSLVYKLVPPMRNLIRSKSDAISALSKSDVLLDQMGISFTDGREKFLLYNTAAILPAFLLRVPVIKCSQAIGPFRNPINRFVSKIFLPRIRTIITRGRITHGLAAELGLKNIIEGSDSAFTLAATGNERESLSKSWDLSFFGAEQKVIGISPSVVVQSKYEASKGNSYLDLMTNYVNTLVSLGYRIALIPHSVRTGTEKTQNNDLPLCISLYARIEDKSGVFFANKELSPQDLRYLIGLCDLFVTSRFHAMVSSLAVGVPCLVIGWSHKYQEVLESFGLEKWAIGFESLALDKLLELTLKLYEEGPMVRTLLELQLPAVRTRALVQERVILELLQSKTS